TRSPLSGVDVTASLTNGGGITRWGTSQDAPSSTDGHFTITDVPRGEVAIDCLGKDSSRRFSTLSAVRTIAATRSPNEIVDVGDTEVAVRPDKQAETGSQLVVPAGDAADRAPRASFIAPDGPAARAGLTDGDVIVAIDGMDVTGPAADRAS